MIWLNVFNQYRFCNMASSHSHINRTHFKYVHLSHFRMAPCSSVCGLPRILRGTLKDVDLTRDSNEAALYDSKHESTLDQLIGEIRGRLDFIGANWKDIDESSGSEVGRSSPKQTPVRLLDYACGTGCITRVTDQISGPFRVILLMIGQGSSTLYHPLHWYRRF